MSTIKTTFLRISIHPLFYIFLALAALSGSFRRMILFTSLILVHELGHYITAYLFHWKVDKIVLYPYGGCSYFEVDLNCPNVQEFIVLLMGPIFQLIFTYWAGAYLREMDFSFLLSSSKMLLLFNLLPIYPLDGGKLLFLFLSSIFSYYYALKITFYSSLFNYFLLLFIVIFFYQSVFWMFLFFSLFFRFWKEQKKGNYLYQKFLLERYLKSYSFQKERVITSPSLMKKGYHHVFLVNGKMVSEKEYLKRYFSFG